MAARQGLKCSNGRPRSKLTSEVQLHVSGSVFTADKELLAQKSEKIAKLLQKRPASDDLSHQLRDIHADQESLELVARFCHGFEINLSTENVIRVACVANYLGMTENHCPNNLLSKALSFFEQQICPSWNKCIKALKAAESILQPALQLGLVDHCVESIILKVLDDPRLLGEPIKTLASDEDSDENENAYRPNARRKLFDLDWKSEDLTTLSLRLYAPIIHAMIQRQAPEEYVAANICQYTKKWIISIEKGGENEIPLYKRNFQREIVETLEKLLPHQRGIVPCTFLFEMLRFAIFLDANDECKNGLELRIGKQLDQASVQDLLIPSQGYAKDEQYDTERVRRILKNFYLNYTGPDTSGLNAVAELIDEFLAEISADIDLKVSTFLAIADMSVGTSAGTLRTSDGIYRALDIYLEKHKHLTESEREELCGVLDCNKLSAEACEHAAQNGKLPLRVVVHVLFVGQLKLRDAIAEEVQGSDCRLLKMAEEEEEEGGRIEEEDVKVEMEKMGSKVMELERECHVMRREIQRGGSKTVRRPKVSLWKEMKRKFGCVTSIHDLNCHEKRKKVHTK